MLQELLKGSRSYRRFVETYNISESTLKYLVGLTRYAPSARNSQPLKYIICNKKNKCADLFYLLNWAGYLTDWEGPEEGERPSAYIIMLQDTSISENIFCDDGMALQTIMLGAAEKKLGGCIIGSFHKAKLRDLISLPIHLKPLYVIALGKPKEEVVIDEINGNDFKYWRDSDDIHHVPKRSQEELIFSIRY